MALFDLVEIECELPDKFTSDKENCYQTYELEQRDYHYRITKNNILVRVISSRALPEEPPLIQLVPFKGQLDIYWLGDIKSDNELREYSFYFNNGIALAKVGNLFKNGIKSICEFVVTPSGQIRHLLKKEHDY